MSQPQDRPERFVRWVLGHRRVVVAVVTALALVGAARTVMTYAQLRSDLEELLPTSAPSVAALDRLRSRLPGLRHLGIVVETGGAANVAAASRFVEDLATRVRSYGPDVVEDVRVGIAEERAFAETFALQLMEPGDVTRLRKAAEARRDWEVTRASGLDLLDEEEDPAPELPFDELRQKYERRHGGTRRFPNDRFVSSDGAHVVMVVRASAHGTGIGADDALLGRVRADAADLGFPDAYAPGMRMGFAGDVPTRVEEMDGLIADLSLSGLLVTALVVLVIVAYFRSFRSLLILGLPLFVGTVWAFGLVALPPLSVRHLNSNTAFLGSIVVGNGINSGIILLARFREEHAERTPIVEAIIAAVRRTWRPTLAAAAAASAAYGSLVFTDFRGFNQFGWIGGIGMLACWAATFALAPILVERWGAGIRRPAASAARGSRLGALGLRYPTAMLLATLGLSALAVAGMAERRADWLETDFSKLRRRDSWVDGERYWGKLMDRTLGRYLTPTVILAPSADEARVVAARVRQLARERRAGDLVASVRDVSALVPPERDASLVEARKLRGVLTPRLEAQLSDEDRRRVKQALSDAALRPVRPDDVPGVLAAGLREKDGRMDRNVLVFPKLTSGTWDATRMAEFTADLRQAAGDPGRTPVAGSLLLSSDIVAAMKQDGPRATAVALGVVCAVAMLAFRSLSLSVGAVLSLLAGVLLMLGSLAWGGQRFNFSNFVALPITFGIAADYSINVLKRFQSEGSKDAAAAVASTGGAVALCSATTIIGFGSLLVAQNQALFSFGVFAVAGEIACLATAVWALPAALALRVRAGAAAAARRAGA